MRTASALYWLPRIEAAGLPVPKTIFVPLVGRAARVVGGEAFLRTDLASAKHAGADAYHVTRSGRGLRIAREWRFFAEGDRVLCAHPYWPAGALEGQVDGCGEWRDWLEDLHRPPAAMAALDVMAMRAAAVCEGAWSVDFAQDVEGKWWLIDMAPAEVSWHWPGCTAKREAA